MPVGVVFVKGIIKGLRDGTSSKRGYRWKERGTCFN